MSDQDRPSWEQTHGAAQDQKPAAQEDSDPEECICIGCENDATVDLQVCASHAERMRAVGMSPLARESTEPDPRDGAETLDKEFEIPARVLDARASWHEAKAVGETPGRRDHELSIAKNLRVAAAALRGPERADDGEREQAHEVVDYVWKKALESTEPDHFVNRREYVRLATDRILAICRGETP